MNIYNKLLIFIACVCVAVTGIMFAFSKEKDTEQEKKQVYVREENIDKPEDTEPSVVYEVGIEENTVVLYSIKEDEKKKIDSVIIDRSYYPVEDIQELTEGIRAYNIEDGYKILENFAN